MELSGKRIGIIGGSSGIGLAVTRLLSEHGATLAITGRNSAKLAAVQAEIPGVEETAAFDFNEEGAVKRFFESTGALDHLVIIAAGSPRTGPFLAEGGLDNIRGYVDQKLRGVLNTAYHGVPRLRPDGSVVFFIGGAGRRAFPGCTPLAIVNTAIVGLAKTLAVEIKPKRVNVVCPGAVDTGCWDDMGEEEKRRFLESCAAGNPLGRLGTPEDSARAVLFLLSAEYMNGIVLDVVGGETIDFMH